MPYPVPNTLPGAHWINGCLCYEIINQNFMWHHTHMDLKQFSFQQSFQHCNKSSINSHSLWTLQRTGIKVSSHTAVVAFENCQEQTTEGAGYLGLPCSCAEVVDALHFLLITLERFDQVLNNRSSLAERTRLVQEHSTCSCMEQFAPCSLLPQWSTASHQLTSQRKSHTTGVCWVNSDSPLRYQHWREIEEELQWVLLTPCDSPKKIFGYWVFLKLTEGRLN